MRLILHIRRTTAREYPRQAPWTERTDDTPDGAGTKKIDLSSCAFPHDGDWFNEVPDPSFLWRCALAFSPRGLDHAKRRCRDRVAPYFFVTVYIHYMKIICYLPLKVTLQFHPVVSRAVAPPPPIPLSILHQPKRGARRPAGERAGKKHRQSWAAMRHF